MSADPSDAQSADVELFPPCMYCRRLTHIGSQDLTGWTCKAFPEEIPYGILTRKIRHDAQVFGDNGLQYDPEKTTLDDGKTYIVDFDGSYKEVSE